MLEVGFSKTTLGLLIGSSSIFGAIFDFLLCKYVDNAHFRKMYFFMLILGAIIPMMLIGAKTVWLFLIIMALWGLYYDLRNFGHWDFMARCEPAEERSSAFSLMAAIKGSGYVLAPLIAGFLIGEVVGNSPLIMAGIFFIIAIMGYMVLLGATKKTCDIKPPKIKRRSGFIHEIKVWNRLGHKILPVIGTTFLLGIIDAFFWSVGPIFAESLTTLQNFRGLFLTAYFLPVIFVVWFIKPVIGKFGKKKTSLYSALFSLLIFSTISIINNEFLIIFVVFIAATLLSLAWPANDGVYADFISESEAMEKEVKGLGDFSCNLGYVVGPVIAGILMDVVGNSASFTYLGIGGAIFAILLLLITPKSITVPKR